jgi:spore germination cell wall hydrolase CwlJ-like protein
MNILQGIFWIMLTVYHEARGETDLGQKNVVKVILNRASRHNWPVENVVRAKKQFSCFNAGLEGMIIRDIPAMVKVANNVYEAVEDWRAGERLQGATHYYASSGPNRIQPPYWADSMTVVGKWGNHTFLRES